MPEIYEPGLIFISHASTDKGVIKAVLDGIPKSHLFYDIDTINPGTHTIEALDDGLLSATVFVMFVSPSTPKSAWVEYESSVAYVQKIKRKNISILAVPIRGCTYEDAPEWMRRYMAVPITYSSSDIARLIRYSYDETLSEMGIVKKAPFVGREDFCNKIIVDVKTRAAEKGVPVNFLVLSGLQNMGRMSIAKAVESKIYPGSRRNIPVFDLSNFADSIDLYLALAQDITGAGGAEWMEKQIAAFPTDDERQADILFNNLKHFAEINQTVVIRSAYGLRDQKRDLKPWLRHLFALMRSYPDIRVIWLSERMLPPEELEPYPNVLQYQVKELSDESILFLLTELIDVDSTPPSALMALAPHVRGHPGTAQYVASLLRGSQRPLETLIQKPDAIRSFQRRCIEGAISESSIGGLGREVLSILSVLPHAGYDLLQAVFKDYPKEKLAQTMWDMTDNCICTYSATTGYKISELVRSNLTLSEHSPSESRLLSLSEELSNRLSKNKLSVSTIESAIFVYTKVHGNVSEKLKNLLTGSILLEIVNYYYNLGHTFRDKWEDSFRTAARLSLMAVDIPVSVDTLETILFSGADSLGCVDKRDSQISRGLIQGFFFGGGSLGLSERCERRCVGDH